MSIVAPRTRPKQYRCYLVRPTGEFLPKNWQDKPKRFTVVQSEPALQTPSLGKADAWRFLANQAAIASGNFTTWAVWLS